MTQLDQFTVSSMTEKIRRVTFTHAPYNVVDADTVAQLLTIVTDLSADEQVQVVIFDSGNPGFFYNHADLMQMNAIKDQVTPDSTPAFVELTARLNDAPFVSIAAIRGFTRGGGDEIALAFDLRYASREHAGFNQPEVGVGLVPGGGGADRLARLIGRDRAIEVILTSDDYDAIQAERWGWVTRAVPDAELDALVEGIATRIASFDKTSALAAKAQISRVTTPSKDELRALWAEFVASVPRPGFQDRFPAVGELIGRIGPDELEQKLGHYIGVANQQS